VPVETRRLTFSRPEIISAALDYCQRGHIARPVAELDDIELDADPRHALRLRFRVASPVEPDEVVLAAPDVIEALVSFCRFAGVPLPNETEKRLEIADGELVMYFRIERRPRRSCAPAA
jgi:hypothetical protein